MNAWWMKKTTDEQYWENLIFSSDIKQLNISSWHLKELRVSECLRPVESVKGAWV